MLHALKKYLRIYGKFISNSIMAQMEYRVNFIISCLIQLANMGIKLTYVIVLYRTDVVINGFTPDEMMIMIGTYSALSGVFVSFFLINFDALSYHVNHGTLDMYIVKPVSLQFMVTLQRVDLAFAAVSLICGGTMIGIGWHRAGIAWTAGKILGFIGFTLWGIFLTYSVFLIPNLLCFITVSARGLNSLVGQLWDFNNMPMTIYNNVVKLLGTFVIPVLITNIGGLFVMERLSTWLLWWSIAAPIVFFVLCRLLWKAAMKHYVSASS